MKISYSAEELTLFVPIWNEISKDAEFLARIEKIRDIILLADEASLMNGTSPLVPQLRTFREDVIERVKSLNPSLSETQLQRAYFYCLYHEEGSSEYDIGAASKRAAEKSKASRD
jgi:hypothetical protein